MSRINQLSHHLELKRDVSTDHYNQVFDALPTPYIVVDGDHIGYFNPAAEEFFDISSEYAVNHPWSEILTMYDMSGMPLNNAPWHGMLYKSRRNQQLLVYRKKYRKQVPTGMTITRVDRSTSDRGTYAIVFHDFADVFALLRRLQHQCSHDHLTGLVNRHELEQRLIRMLTNAHTNGDRHALILLDLNGFKAINDRFGHATGDDILKQVAFRFRAVLRERDTLARLGGDEFAVLLEHCATTADAMQAARMLRLSLTTRSFSVSGQQFDVTTSIGVVAIDNESSNIRRALIAADAACYLAKKQSTEHVRLYQRGDEELAFGRKSPETNILTPEFPQIVKARSSTDESTH